MFCQSALSISRVTVISFLLQAFRRRTCLRCCYSLIPSRCEGIPSSTKAFCRCRPVHLLYAKWFSQSQIHALHGYDISVKDKCMQENLPTATSVILWKLGYNWRLNDLPILPSRDALEEQKRTAKSSPNIYRSPVRNSCDDMRSQARGHLTTSKNAEIKELKFDHIKYWCLSLLAQLLTLIKRLLPIARQSRCTAVKNCSATVAVRKSNIYILNKNRFLEKPSYKYHEFSELRSSSETPSEVPVPERRPAPKSLISTVTFVCADTSRLNLSCLPNAYPPSKAITETLPPHQSEFFTCCENHQWSR